MLDWVHSKVLREPACTDAPPGVLASWVELALLRRGLAPEHVAPVVARVIDLKDEYADGIARRDTDAVRRNVSEVDAERLASHRPPVTVLQSPSTGAGAVARRSSRWPDRRGDPGRCRARA